MKVVMISDTHTKWDNLVIPECDVLISAGDYSNMGEYYSVAMYHKWLSKQPAKHIISLQGNHELYVEKDFNNYARYIYDVAPKIHFVCDKEITIDKVKFYCNSTTPYFCAWAWNAYPAQLQETWEKIPKNTNVLVTHGPPLGILDLIDPWSKDHLGCQYLRRRISKLKKLKLHVFGHIHGGSGEIESEGVKYVNASICNEGYDPINPVRVFELNQGKS